MDLKLRPDPVTYNHLRRHVHQLVMNPASSETLSGRHSQSGVHIDGEKALTPNLRLVTLDKAHGTLRIMKRPLHADPILGPLLENFALGMKSLVHVVDYSKEI